MFQKSRGSVKFRQVLDDPGCATFYTGVTRCSVFQKSRGSVKFGQVLDDLGCASFYTGVTRCSCSRKVGPGFPEIRAGTG